MGTQPKTAAFSAFVAGLAAVPLGGGYTPWVLYALALAVLLLTVLTIGRGNLAAPSRSTGIALVGLGLFTAWQYASALWADAPADAWAQANRTLVYAGAFAIAALGAWTEREGRIALAVVGGGVTAIAAGLLLYGAVKHDPPALFRFERLAAPTGYVNASAIVWLAGFWPAFQVAHGWRGPWPARAAAYAAACLLLECALLAQSRGALAAFGVTALLYIALAPRRATALAALAGLAGLVAVAWGPLVGRRDLPTVLAVGPGLGAARVAIALTCAAAFVVATAAIALVPAERLSHRSVPRFPRVPAIAAASLATAAALAAIVAVGHPVSWAQERWEDFKTTSDQASVRGSTRLQGGLESTRYDFYRVALDEFRAHPVAGIGAGNFRIPYVRERQTREAPHHPHSFAIGTLSQVGLVGAVLFLVFLCSALGSALSRIRGPSVAAAGVSAAATACFVVWFAHGLVDYVWEFSAIGVAAFGLLAIAGRVGTDAKPVRRRPTRSAAIATAVGILGAALLVPPGLAAVLSAAAYRQLDRDPAQAADMFGRAAGLDFLSAEPLLAQAVVARRIGDVRTARVALDRAQAREPLNWLVRFEQGLLSLSRHDTPTALRHLADARTLNPGEPLIRQVDDRAERRRPVDPGAVEQRLALGVLEDETGFLAEVPQRCAGTACDSASAELMAQARRRLDGEPRRALATLMRAARLDFLSAEPLLAQAVVARRLGDTRAARDALDRAQAREPLNWLVRFEHGLLSLSQDDRPTALRHLADAGTLNPGERLIRQVTERAENGRPVDLRAAERRVLNG